MKILLVSWTILPWRSGSAFIVEKLARNFSAEDMVVVGGRSLRLEKTKRAAGLPRFYYLFSELHLLGRGARFFVLPRLLLFPYVVLHLTIIARRERCTHVVGVFPDIYYCFAALLVSKLLGLKFSSYFHNTYLDNRKGWAARLARYLQPKVFAASDRVFVMSDGMQAYFADAYHIDHVLPLRHSFSDRPSIEPASLSGSPWKCVLVGNINLSNTDATQRVINAIKNDDRYQLSIYTQLPRVLMQARGFDMSALDYRGFIDDEDLPTALQEFDIFILAHGFTGGLSAVEYQTIFPTRTIPLLVSGRPILLHSPPHAFLTEFCKEHDCAEVVDDASEAAVIAGLDRLVSDSAVYEQRVKNGLKTAELFYGPHIAKTLLDELKADAHSRG